MIRPLSLAANYFGPGRKVLCVARHITEIVNTALAEEEQSEVVGLCRSGCELPAISLKYANHPCSRKRCSILGHLFDFFHFSTVEALMHSDIIAAR
jgi:hypothetical protein